MAQANRGHLLIRMVEFLLFIIISVEFEFEDWMGILLEIRSLHCGLGSHECVIV